MKQRLFFFFLAGAWSLAAQQQVPQIPVNQQTVDQVSWVTQALDQLVAAAGGIFLDSAAQLLDRLGVFAIGLSGLYLLYSHLWAHHPHAARRVVQVLGTYMLCFYMLRYYNTPLWFGYSFHQLFTEEARWMQAQIDIKILDQFLKRCADILGLTEKPRYWNIPEVFIYFSVLVNMVVVEAALFWVTIKSFVAIGIGLILGPFAILALLIGQIIPFFSGFFFSWLNFMIKYSLYRVCAAALVFLWATVINGFLDRTLHENYTLAHWWRLLVPFAILNVGVAASVLSVPQFVNDLTTGGAYAGTGVSGTGLFNQWFRRAA